MNTLTPILCADGTTISVQASSGHYCSPRSDNPDRGYGAVEVWVTNKWGVNLTEDPEGWIPAGRVMELIAEHGGAIGGNLPPLNFGVYVKEEGEEE